MEAISILEINLHVRADAEAELWKQELKPYLIFSSLLFSPLLSSSHSYLIGLHLQAFARKCTRLIFNLFRWQPLFNHCINSSSLGYHSRHESLLVSCFGCECVQCSSSS